MENGERKTKRTTRGESGEQDSAFRAPLSGNSICPACGAAARRENARFCLICGKILNEGYEPLDRLRASYNWQQRNLAPNKTEKTEEAAAANLFEQNKNSVSQTAWACLVYSFVPYLGILFVPLTFLIGGFGYLNAVRQPQLGGRRLAVVSIWLSFAVLALQIFLWWLLYIIPEIGKQL